MAKQLVHIVDDDPEMVESICFLLRAERIDSSSYASAEALLEALPMLESGCILLDLRLGGMDGLTLQRELNARGNSLPVVIMTGHGDVGSAVAAMKEGATDFIQKPFSRAELLTAIGAAWKKADEDTRRNGEKAQARLLIETLSPRERQVVAGLAHGKPNKNIAYDLDISPRTIEIHRANAMRKLKSKTLPEMLHVAFLAGIMDD